MNTCAFRLKIGKRHHKYAPSAYQVCITPNQANTLFKEKPVAEGCGVFACVYPHADPNKVVKITRDASDVASLLAAQHLSIAPKVFSYHKLTSQARWTKFRPRTESYQEWPQQPTAYAMVVERVKPLTPTERRLWSRRLNAMAAFDRDAKAHAEMLKYGSFTTPAKNVSIAKVKTKSVRVPTTEMMAMAVCPVKPKAKAAQCERDVQELKAGIVALKRAGITWTDAHGGNIGRDARGRWKILDMGASSTPLDVDVPELAGAGRRRR